MTEKTEFLITAKDQTAAAFKSVESGLGKIGSALFSVQSALLGAAGVAGMGALVKASMDAGDALAKASDRMGIATEALAGLRYAGDLAGVSAEQLDTGLQKMSIRLAEAAGGSKQADEAFRALGLSSQQLAQMPADQAFMRIGDALMSVDNNMQRLNLTQDIFGRGATEIVNLMAEGSEGMQAAANEAKALGLALSRVDAAKLEIANDQFTRVKGILSGIGNTIALQLSPYIQAAGDWLVRLTVESDGFRGAITTAMTWAVKGVGVLADGFHGLHIIWKLLEQGWFELQNVVVQGLERMVNGVRAVADLLPGIEVKPDAGLQQWAAQTTIEIERTREVLQALLTEELPSTGIERAVEALQALNQAAAEAKTAQAAGISGFGDVPDAPGIGDKETEQTQKYMAELGKQLAALYESTAPRLEALAIKYAEEQALLDQGYINNLLSEQLYYEQSAALRQQYEDKKTQIELHGLTQRELQERLAQQRNLQVWQSGAMGKLQIAGQIMGQLAGLMASGNKKEFEIGKKAAIAHTTISTIQAAMDAYKGFATIPIVGTVLGAVAAAATVAMGMANVRKIQSQQFGGSPSTPTFRASPVTGIPSGQPGGDAGTSLAAPSLPQNAQAGGPPRVVNINIQSDSGMVSTAWVREQFAPVFADAVGDGVIRVNVN